MKTLFKFILTFFLLPHLYFSQEVLTIDEAIKLGLEKNLTVLVAKNEVEISQTRNNLGNAGMTPQLSLNGNYNFANINSYQEFGNGTIQDRKGAQNNNTGASLNMNWVVFDGMKMFAIKKRLQQTEQLSSIQLKQQIENVVYNIIVNYYDIVRISQLINAAKQNIEIYEERLKLTKVKLEIGSDSKIDFMLTQNDLNRSKADLLKLEQQLTVTKINLNVLMARQPETDFTVTESIPLNYNPTIDELKKVSSQNNSSVLIAKQNELIANQMIAEGKSTILPQIQLNGAYNFILNKSQAGFVLLNKQQGLNAGISASWLLYSGNKNNKLIKEREIELLNVRHLIDLNIQQTDALSFIGFKNLESNKKIVDLEKENLEAANELVKLSLERYKIGKATLLETKETQKILEDSQARYINALYEAKKSETDLLKVNGTLVK